MKRAQAVKGRNSDAWQLALYRAAGNLEGARDAATAAGEVRVAAQMSILLGDPIPWLRSPQVDGGNEDPTHKLYSTFAIRRWQGKEIRPAEWENFTKLIGNHQPGSQTAMKALFLLGQTELAEQALVKNSPFVAFVHFESLERIPEALKALNLDPENPDYKTWIGKRIEHLSADVEDQHEASADVEQLVTMANFLERRGLDKEADAAFTQPLMALAKKDESIFTNFLRSLFGTQESTSGAPKLAKRIGVAWAGGDPTSWTDLVAAAFGEEDEATAWWEWLPELDPAATRAQRFDAMLALFDIGQDPEKLRTKWIALAWDAIQRAPEARQAELVGRISFVTIQLPGKGNVQESLKAWDKLPANNQNEIFWGRHIEDLSASGRWGEIVEIFLKQIGRMSELKQEPRVEFYAFTASSMRQAGRRDEALKYDALADKLALGNTELEIKIGNAYAFGCDYQRAEEWWNRAIRGCDPDSQEFLSCLSLIKDNPLDRGQWNQAAAVSEVLAQMYASIETDPPPVLLIRQRMLADMAHALSNLKADRVGSIAKLEKCHAMAPTEGSLADSFFPALRKAGLMEEHNKWFNITWDQISAVVEKYPTSDNTLNTAAWLAARARLKLDLAEGFLKKALAMNPEQSAYLDTMAEIQFAKGNRAKALEWSQLAVNFEPQDALLRRQHERFRSDPLPK